MPVHTRRELLALTAAAAACACAGCPLLQATASAVPPPRVGPVDVGTPDDFPRDGIFDRWARDGFFLVRRSGRLYALSSTCTHKKVRLVAGKGGDGFKCPRHGSHFDAAGNATKAPARKPLPRLAIGLDARGHVVVEPAARLDKRSEDRGAASLKLDR